MPHTGLFHLIEVHGDSDGLPRQLAWVASVSATCMGCRQTFTATVKRGLEVVTGGAVLSCPGCGVRQAISNARFNEFKQRVQDRRRPLGAGG